MFPNGFLGTRADLLMDVILIAVIAVPFLLVVSFRKARNKDYKKHALFQWIQFSVVFVAVVFFEFNIQTSGGSGSLVADGRLTQEDWFKSLLFTHIAIAVLTYTSWFYLLIVSARSFKISRLPGVFSLDHKRIGKLIFAGATFTALSGLAVYIVSFVL